MALKPIDETHALQIQAGTIGRKAGHLFEDTISQAINTFKYPFDVPAQFGENVFVGEPASLLLRYIGRSLGLSSIQHAVAISTGALATSELGKQWLTINGAEISRCKSDIVLTLKSAQDTVTTIGVSTKQCNNKTPTNAQLYFTTARGFASLLTKNGINVPETAIRALRQFCGDAGFRPLDDEVAMRNRNIDPRRFFWEEIDPKGRAEWEHILKTNQDKVSRLLFQKAYLNDQIVPDFLLHKTKKASSWEQTEECNLLNKRIDRVE